MTITREYLEASDYMFPVKAFVQESEDKDISFSAHLHDEVELVYCEYGEAEFETESADVKLKAGDILFINRLIIHSCFGAKVPTKIYTVNLNMNILNEAVGAPGYRYLLDFIGEGNVKMQVFNVSDKKNYARFAELITETCEEFRTRRLAYEFVIRSNIYAFFAGLYREGILSPNKQEQFEYDKRSLAMIADVLRYVEVHYSETIKIEEVSETINVNYCYFCRLFKKATGKTFVEYLNHYRVMVAQRKLLEQHKNITDVMFETGFSSHSYFNRIFKQHSGLAPSAYRAKHLNDSAGRAAAGE